jgi:hypothetical protein
VSDHGDLRNQVIRLAHSAGHEGIQKTLHRLRADFYIPCDRALVQDWVRSCATCQRNKTETLQPAGLLQPLEVSSQVWVDISMDFIEGLPKVNGKSVILTVVDRFSKYTHFIVLCHPYTAASVARAFFDGVVRLHGFPSSIVSDWDPVFTGNVWRDLFWMAGVTLRMSTAFHPQTDGQSKVVNKVIAMYLRCVTGDRPRAWVDWLSWAEYCYNTSFHTALRATPFEVVYGRPPPPCCRTSRDPPRRRWWIPCCPAGTWSSRRSASGCCRLSRSPRSTTMPPIAMRSSKWATGCGCACFTGPHGPSTPALRGSLGRAMLVRSRSLSGSARWPIVSSFRPVRGSTTSSTWDSSSVTTVFHRRCPDPYRRCWTAGFFQRQTSHFRLNNSAASGTSLFNGRGLPHEEATWESLVDFQQQYPDFQLEDELFAYAGRDVMTGLVYHKRKPKSG